MTDYLVTVNIPGAEVLWCLAANQYLQSFAASCSRITAVNNGFLKPDIYF